MYCHNCGNELPEGVKYCMHCGAIQDNSKKTGGNNKGRCLGRTVRNIIIAAICVPLILLGGLVVLAVFAEEDGTENGLDTFFAEEPQIPESGWYEENGERYYFEESLMYVELHEIDNELYYFYEDGRLAVNADIEYEGCTLEAGADGSIHGVIYDIISGEWAEEDYKFGYGGSSSVLELTSEVEDCDYMTLYLEANGQYGAKVNGTWKFYIRRNDTWEFVKKFEFNEPSGSFKIYFDEPVDFDAITAHPTVQGNASYSSLFYLKNVHVGM